MLRLNSIPAHKGATHRKKRLGRGAGSGHGITSGKGDKGQLARSGGHVRVGFEGGQMPLYRRIPKRGFKNIGRRTQVLFNVADLEKWEPKTVGEISLANLQAKGLVKGRYDRLAILGTGELTKAFQVKAHHISAQATEKIKKAGGQVELLPIPGPQPRKKKVKATDKKADQGSKA